MISTWAPASSLCAGAADCYARISGTSAAAPMVAGAAALIASMPGAPSGAALKNLILKHVDPLAALKGKVWPNLTVHHEKTIQKGLNFGKKWTTHTKL